MVYLSGSAIADLLACSLMNANKHLRAGHFGPVLWRGPRPYAAQTAVEQRVGRQFSAEQLALVAIERDRILDFPDQEVA